MDSALQERYKQAIEDGREVIDCLREAQMPNHGRVLLIKVIRELIEASELVYKVAADEF